MHLLRSTFLVLALAAPTFAQESPSKVIAVEGRASPAQGKIRALLVGIGAYPPQAGPEFPPLDRPPNDLRRMEAFLRDQFGHRTTGTLLTLRDSEATGQGIQKAIREHLILGCGPDDVALFFFAGHGTQIDDLGPDIDEEDGLDEAIVPVDFSPQDTSTWLTDDMIGRLLAAIPARQVIVVFDCCHAGDGTRGIRGGHNPFLWSASRSVGPPDTSMREEGAPDHHLFLAACADGELAHQIYDEDAGANMGVFTRSLCHLAGGKAIGNPLDALQEELRDVVGREVRRLHPNHVQRPVIEAVRREISLQAVLEGVAPGPAPGAAAVAARVRPADPGIQDGFTPSGPVKVTLRTDKPAYVWTEDLTATVILDRDAWLRVYHVDSQGHVTQLHPNAVQPARKIPAGETVHLPPREPVEGRVRKLRVTGPNQGLEMLVAVASTEPFAGDAALDFGGGLFLPLPDVTPAETMTRGVGVEPRPETISIPAQRPVAIGQALRIFRVSQF